MNKLVEIEAIYIHHTDDAIKILDGNDQECWIPFSAIPGDLDRNSFIQGEVVQFSLTESRATALGLI